MKIKISLLSTLICLLPSIVLATPLSYRTIIQPEGSSGSSQYMGWNNGKEFCDEAFSKGIQFCFSISNFDKKIPITVVFSMHEPENLGPGGWEAIIDLTADRPPIFTTILNYKTQAVLYEGGIPNKTNLKCTANACERW